MKYLTLIPQFTPRVAKDLYFFIPKILINISKRLRQMAFDWQNFPRKIGASQLFVIVPMEHIPNCQIIYRETVKNEVLYFPKIYELTNGGEISIETKGPRIFRLNNASFVMGSDFIRFAGGSVSNDKLFRKEYEYGLPGDCDLFDLDGNSCRLKKYSKQRKFDTVLHISGSFFHQWAHFLVQFYPKLELIPKLPMDRVIDILIPIEIDPHIKYIIENAIRGYKNIRLTQVSKDEELCCNTIYYPQIDTYLVDIGVINSMFHIQISDSTIRFLRSSTKNLFPKNSKQFRKIYIGRVGSRNIINGTEVAERFRLMGFEEIFPHKLDILEKVKIFSEAKYIVGPGSSGFANAIFCQPKTKILSLTNSSRHDDMYLTKLSKLSDFELIVFTGKQIDSYDNDSAFYIDLSKLNKFIAESNFFEMNLS
jgi:hypothetical protein